MKITELLPIGTVVLLKGGQKRLMIFGVKQKKSDTGENFDYIAVVYPEGNIGYQGQFLFNHEDIDQVCYKGFEDEERNNFIKNLEGYYSSQS